MSNKDEDFAPYYKVRWSRRSAWTISQAAYLSLGLDPDGLQYEISPTATNVVSKRHYWLLNKINKEVILVVENKDGVEYYNPGSLYRALKEKFSFDKEMEKIFNHMYDAEQGIPSPAIVNRSVYRQAGRIIYNIYPNAIKQDVAEILVDLPKYYNTGGFGKISALTSDQIAELLKGIGKLSGKPLASEKPVLEVNLAELIENM